MTVYSSAPVRRATYSWVKVPIWQSVASSQYRVLGAEAAR